MIRSSTTEAVVLRKTRVGEIHKALTLFSRERGLISAIAHGAFKIKSRLRTTSEPFHLVRVYLYHDPVRDQYKITDMESLSALDGIRASVQRYYAASLWAEVVIRSYGGGENSSRLFQLLVDSLCLLNQAPKRLVTLLNCQYLLRFLEIVGQRPDVERCGLCASELDGLSGGYVSQEEQVLVCGRCASPTALHLPAGALRYLQRTLKTPLEAAVRVGLEGQSLEALTQATYFLVQAVLETNLNSLRSGVGIL
ncbi:MAG: DNA repair protein RecO [Spirochaetaceae bacterium]|nr:MAG: DNA repair protein RecO [Spirochaetaceae bacterium]